MTIQEYYDLLAAHDWQMGYSDDHEKYIGERSQRILLRARAFLEGQIFDDLYLDFLASASSGVLPCRPS